MSWYTSIVVFHFLVHDLVLCATVYTTQSAITTQNVEFVQKLKEDLRRNNDDYVLGRNLTAAAAAAAPGGDSSEHSSAYIDDIEEMYRRALRDRGTEQLALRNQYMIGQASNMVRDDNKTSGVEGARGKTGSFRLRAADPSRERETEHVPSPDQLDMAPAKGGKITRLRNKGRLCQRHVLIPEGPKYDSGGRVYLRAHPPHAARPYPRTPPPRLLLPRCCNCCKKSVLGCE